MKPLLLACALALLASTPRLSRGQAPGATTTVSTTASASADANALAAMPPDERATHQELTAFRIAIQGAFNRMGASGRPEDMRALLDYVHPDVLFTDMTGRSTRGHAELMEYFRRDFLVPDHSLTRMQSVFAADQLSELLRPDVAINRGTAHGTFAFTDGTELAVDTRWTATLVKHDGRWKVAAFHFSPSIFDNPVTNAYKGWIWKAAAIALIAGAAFGLLAGWATWKRRAA